MIHVKPTSPPQSAAPAKPLELYVCPFEIIQDTAEQLPFPFQQIVMGGQQVIIKRVRQHLRTGDYSIIGLEDRLCIERKSPDDLVGSVCGGHVRLEAEHCRMQEMIRAGGFACLVCEGSYSEIDDRLRMEGRDKAADTLLGCVASWPAKFGTPWYFCGDRRRAEIVTFRILYRMWRKLVEEKTDD